MALEFVRRNRRSFLLLLPLWIVILGFIAYFIPTMRQSASALGSGQVIGSVGGLTITRSEFARAYDERQRFYERIYQGRVDANMLRAMGLERQVFENLVTERVVALEAQRLGIAADDAAVAKSIAEDPNLQRDGRFIGRDELRRRLALQGVSVDAFAAEQRARIVARRLEDLVTGAATATPAEAEEAFRSRTEQVKAEYVLVGTDANRQGLFVGDDEIRQRFEARKEAYRIPEKRVVSYALLDPAALRSQASVTDYEIEQYYESHKSEFTEAEQVCASHILVRVKGAAQPEGHAEAEAKTIAEGLLAKVRGGADFAALAKKSSEDKGSQAQGGDLGCFGRGQMLPEFEAAAFGLEAGKTSDLVKTQYGYHIIRAASRRPESTPPLTQVKDRIRETLLSEKAARLADQKQAAFASALARGRSLEEAAREEGVTVQRSAPFARSEPPPPIASRALAARAFALKQGELEKGGFRVVRGTAFIALAEVQPTRLPELKEAQEKVRADLLTEKALARAEAKAREIQARATASSLEKAAAASGLVRKDTVEMVSRGQAVGDLGTSFGLDEALFSLPLKTVSDPIRVAGGYAVIRVLERKAFDPVVFDKEKPALLAELTQKKRDQLFDAYQRQARERYTIEQHLDVLGEIGD